MLPPITVKADGEEQCSLHYPDYASESVIRRRIETRWGMQVRLHVERDTDEGHRISASIDEQRLTLAELVKARLDGLEITCYAHTPREAMLELERALDERSKESR